MKINSHIHIFKNISMKRYLFILLKITTLIFLVYMLFIITKYSVNVVNQEVMIKKRYHRTEEKRKTTYQNMYKSVLEKYNVIKFADTGFANIMLIQMSNQSPNKELMWYWVQQNNPSITYTKVIDMYNDLIALIESKRNEFTYIENELQQLKFEHDSLLSIIPSKFVVGRRKPIIYKPILSDKTDVVFRTNKE